MWGVCGFGNPFDHFPNWKHCPSLAYAVTRGVEASGACVRMEFFNFVVIGVEMQFLLNTYKIHLYAFE